MVFLFSYLFKGKLSSLLLLFPISSKLSYSFFLFPFFLSTPLFPIFFSSLWRSSTMYLSSRQDRYTFYFFLFFCFALFAHGLLLFFFPLFYHSSILSAKICLFLAVCRIRFFSSTRIRVRVAKKICPKSWKISSKYNQNHKNVKYFFQKYLTYV